MPGLTFRCEACQAILRVPNPDLAGKLIRCPKCSQPTRVQPLADDAEVRSQPQPWPGPASGITEPRPSALGPVLMRESRHPAVPAEMEAPLRAALKKPARRRSPYLTLALLLAIIIVPIVVIMLIYGVNWDTGPVGPADKPGAPSPAKKDEPLLTTHWLFPVYSSDVPKVNLFEFDGLALSNHEPVELLGAVKEYAKDGKKTWTMMIFRLPFLIKDAKLQPFATLKMEEADWLNLSPTGGHVLVPDGGDKKKVKRDAAAEQWVGSFYRLSAKIPEITFASDGSAFVIAEHNNSNGTTVFNVRTTKGELKGYSFADKSISSPRVSLTPQGNAFLVRGGDSSSNHIFIGNLGMGKMAELELPVGVLAEACLMPDGKSQFLCYADAGTTADPLKCGHYDMRSKKLRPFDAAVGFKFVDCGRVHLSADGKIAAVLSKELACVWDTDSGKLIAMHKLPGDCFFPGMKASVLSVDGQYLAVACENGAIFVWKLLAKAKASPPML